MVADAGERENIVACREAQPRRRGNPRKKCGDSGAAGPLTQAVTTCAGCKSQRSRCERVEAEDHREDKRPTAESCHRDVGLPIILSNITSARKSWPKIRPMPCDTSQL